MQIPFSTAIGCLTNVLLQYFLGNMEEVGCVEKSIPLSRFCSVGFNDTV